MIEFVTFKIYEFFLYGIFKTEDPLLGNILMDIPLMKYGYDVLSHKLCYIRITGKFLWI